jgi:hypothetical protein
MKKTFLIVNLAAVLLISCEAEKFAPIISINSPEGTPTMYSNLSNMNIDVLVTDVDKDLKDARFRIIKNDDSAVLLDTTINAPAPSGDQYSFNFNWQVFNPSGINACKLYVKATDLSNNAKDEYKDITLN